MKKKNLKKLAKLLYKEARDYETKFQESIPTKSEINRCDSLEYDEEISNKFYNFVCNLVKLRDRLNVNVSERYIGIDGNINQPTGGKLKEDYIDIRIYESDFSVTRNYSRSYSFKDPHMLERLKPQLFSKFKEISKESLLDIIDDVMVTTGLSRENNLEEILKG
jgi:hypothetical protein